MTEPHTHIRASDSGPVGAGAALVDALQSGNNIPSDPESVALARIAAAIRELPRGEAAPDLAARVMAAIAARHRSFARVFAPRLALAAALLLGLAAASFLLRGLHNGVDMEVAPVREGPERAAGEARKWLLAAQQPDGAWASGRNSGLHRPAMTALGLMALVSGNERLDAATQSGAQRAIRWLVASQREDGLLAEPNAAASVRLYHHGMATVALLTALPFAEDSRGARAAIERAMELIEREQAPSGGWAYSPGGAPKAGVSGWAMRALTLAGDAKIALDEMAIRKAVHWLRRMTDGAGQLTYSGSTGDGFDSTPTLTAMGVLCLDEASARLRPELRDTLRLALRALRIELERGDEHEPDYYRWFLTASAIRSRQEPAFARWRAQLEQRLVSSQIRDGADVGSWAPEGRWSSMGGRVFSTAAATLSLSARRER